MHLIHLLLPLYDNDGKPLPKSLFADVRNELIQRFGGLTAHTRAPVSGLWQEDDDSDAVRDELIIFEILADGLDTAWWQAYRGSLERRFRQEQVLIRAHRVDVL